MKIKCPHCGSFNTDYYADKVFTFYYRLKKNGSPYKRPFDTTEQGEEAYGYVCHDCHEISGIDGMSDWEVK